jgi:hypothetical protein
MSFLSLSKNFSDDLFYLKLLLQPLSGDEQRAVLAQMSAYNSFFSVLRNRGISDTTDIRRG